MVLVSVGNNGCHTESGHLEISPNGEVSVSPDRWPMFDRMPSVMAGALSNDCMANLSCTDLKIVLSHHFNAPNAVNTATNSLVHADE